MITRLAILTSKQLAKLILAGSLGALLVLLVAGVMVLENRPDLKPWHKPLLTEEFRAGTSIASFSDYLELENRLFSQLEHFPIFGNRWGFPARRITDSRCGLVEEASLHDEISFQGHSRAGCFCG